jgi:hypothetical protein
MCEIGHVDVLVTGREGRWKTVPEGAVRRLDAEWLGRPWDETRLGPCPIRPNQLQVTKLPISREEYDNTRQCLREARNPRDFVDGLRAADLNIRVMMRDSFGVDVPHIEGAVAQVSQIGLRGVEEEMDEWEQGEVKCTDSPNPQPRKMKTTDRTGESRGRLAQSGRTEPSGVRTRLFGGEEQDDRGGGGVTPRGFATPPHFATNSNVGTGGGGAGDGGRQAGSMLEEAMALVLRQSHLTRHDLAQTNAAVEILARRGHSAVPDAGAPEKRIAFQQAERDKQRLWEFSWPRVAEDHDETTGMVTFMNTRALGYQYREKLCALTTGDVLQYQMQEQVLAADDQPRASMTIVVRPGELVSLLDLMEVSKKWQEYYRKVMGAAARATRDDKTLGLTEKQLGNLDHYSSFLQAFASLQEYLAATVRYGKDQHKIWLNIYRGIQYSLGNDITADQKRTMAVMGWSPFDNASLQTMGGGVGAGVSGGVGGGTVMGGAGGPVGVSVPGGPVGLTPLSQQRLKAVKKETVVKEAGSYLPEGTFTLGTGGHLVDGKCALCDEVGHFRTECPKAFQNRYGQPMPGFKMAAGGEIAEQLRKDDYYGQGGGASEKVLKEWARHEWAPHDRSFEEQLTTTRPRTHFWEGWKAVFRSL